MIASEEFGIVSSTSYWLSIDGDRLDDTDNLPGSASVVIVGGGLMGVATAYGLVEQGVDVVLLEAGRLAGGATGRSVGVFLPGTAPVEDVGHLSSVLRREGIDAGLQRRGHLSLASTHEVFEAFEGEVARRSPTAPQLKALDHRSCEEVTGVRIDKSFVGGRWMPSGQLINPVAVVHGLARALRLRGARIAQHTTVTEVHSGRAGRQVVCTTRTPVHARHVVYACNSAVTHLAPLAPRLVPRRGQVLATEPLPAIFPIGMAVDYGNVYWRQADDGVILIGGCRSRGGSGEEDTSTEAVTPAVQKALESFLPMAFPDLPPIRVRRRWSGIMDSSDDGRPVVGPLPRSEGQWVIAGFGGHGLPAGLGAGRALAESIISDRSSPLLSAYDPARLLPKYTRGQIHAQ
jgi:sarcosine oxidase subunit beta